MNFSFRAFLLKWSVVANVLIVARRLLGKHFRDPFPRFIPGFLNWSLFRQHFVRNVVFGVGILFVVVILSLFNFSLMANNQNVALDWMMRLSVNLSDKNSYRPSQVWIDVDEATYRDKLWGGGEPATLPLTPLAKLIKHAVEFEKARYVVVDFTIDGREDVGCANDGGENTPQEQFAEEMQNLLDQNEKLHLLFMRTIREPLKPLPLPRVDSPKVFRSVRPSVLDALIAKNPGRVHAAAPNFVVSADNILRHWKLWESACWHAPDIPQNGKGRWVVLPSPQLILKALMQQQSLYPQPAPWSQPWPLGAEASEEGPVCAIDNDGVDAGAPPDPSMGSQMADFKAGRWVQEQYNFKICYQQDLFTKADCNKKDFFPRAEKTEATAWSNFLEACTRVFSLRAEKTEAKPEEALGNRVYFRISDRDPWLPSFKKWPALAILKEKIDWDSSEKKDPIVVIGASYKDSCDYHVTPLGRMPGALVLVNSIDSLLSVGILQPVNPWLEGMAVFVVLCAVSAIFALFPTSWAATAMVVVIMIFMVPISFYLLGGHGFWVDITAPIIGIYLIRSWRMAHKELCRRLPNKSKEPS